MRVRSCLATLRRAAAATDRAAVRGRGRGKGRGRGRGRATDRAAVMVL